MNRETARRVAGALVFAKGLALQLSLLWNRAPNTAGASQARPWSLRRRLILVVLGASVLLWIISLGTMAFIAWKQTSDVFDDGLKEGARLIVETLSQQNLQRNLSNPPVPDGGRVRLDYQLIVDSHMIRHTGHAPDKPFVDDLDADKEKGFRTVFADGQPWRVYVLRNRNPNFEVQIGQPYKARLKLLQELTENLIWPAVVLLALLGVVTWIAIQRVMRPLEETARAIARKSATDLTPLQQTDRPLELQPVVEALNRVFGQLSRAIEGERRFTADAAHELRTPLAALRMKTQLLQRQYPDQRLSLQSLRDDVDRCTGLVENLLMLARLDHPDDLMRTTLALDGLVDDVRQERATFARDKYIRIEARCHEAQAYGNEELLRIALGNLIDNAIRYCAPGSVVRVEATIRAGVVTLSVRDNGPGVPVDVRNQLAERFFRVLGSGQPGSGLGLSIVARIATLHGSTLHFEEGLDGQGLGVAMDLPLAGRHHAP